MESGKKVRERGEDIWSKREEEQEEKEKGKGRCK